jgi:hypothetical protein
MHALMEMLEWLNVATAAMLQCADTVATPGDLEAAYADAVRGEKSGVHLLRLCQKTGPMVGTKAHSAIGHGVS